MWFDRDAFAQKFHTDPIDQFPDAPDAIAPTELGYFFGAELSVSFYSPAIREELTAIGMKYGMFFEQDRYA